MRAGRSSLSCAWRWGAGLTLVVLFGSMSPAAAAPPEACTDPSFAVPPPSAAGDPGYLLGQAGVLAGRGELEAAERLYEFALEGSSDADMARQGLAHVAARRLAAQDAVQAAEERATTPDDVEACYHQALELDRENATAAEGLAEEPDDGTTATAAADRWDAFYQGWIDPLGRLLLPALAVLAVLLVVARMVTSWVVRVDATEWCRRRAAWRWGLLLLVAVAGFAAALAVTPQLRGGNPLWHAGSLIVIAGLALVVCWVLRQAGRLDGMSRKRSLVVIIATLIAGAAAIGAVAGASGWARAWLWVLTAAVAVLGVVLVAAGRGHALRLLVQVKRGEKADAMGTAYVLGRLQELGTSPPQGLKTPQQVDVSDLPSAALSSLPGGRFAQPLAQLLGLVLPSVPWRATVEDGRDDGVLVVTLTRNGVVAQTAVIDAAGFLLEAMRRDDDGGGAGGENTSGVVDRGDLLTAASAVIITELAERHVHLKVGLCGARRWESVAAHVVATKPPASDGGADLRRELLAYAVEIDPRNALAQLAYLDELADGAHDVARLTVYAQRLEILRARIEAQVAFEQAKDDRGNAERGYLPLQLRLAHSLTATRLNIAAAAPPSRRSGLALDAATEHRRLTALLRRAGTVLTDAGGRRFAAALRAVAAELELAVAALHAGEGGAPPGASTAAPPSSHPLPELLRQLSERRQAVGEAVVRLVVTAGAVTSARRAPDGAQPERRRAAADAVHGAPADDRHGTRWSAVESALVGALAAWFAQRVITALVRDAQPTGQSSAGTSRAGGPTARSDSPSLLVLFDEACRLAATGNADDALLDLELAAGLRKYRKRARTDPWFEEIRGRGGDGTAAQRRFWELVGEPAPPRSFLELPPFGTKAEALRSAGITSEAEVVIATRTVSARRDLARLFEVPVSTVDRWRDIAALAEQAKLSSREIDLLLAVGVSSPRQWRAGCRGGSGTDLLTALVEEARTRQTPLADGEFASLRTPRPEPRPSSAAVSGDGATRPVGAAVRR